jgi:hypothetical protein
METISAFIFSLYSIALQSKLDSVFREIVGKLIPDDDPSPEF